MIRMLSDGMLKRYGLYGEMFENRGLEIYLLFLQATDYVACKLAEAQFLGTTLDEDYTEVLQARECAREQIRQLTNS